VGIHLERGARERVLVLRRHQLRYRQGAAHSAGGLAIRKMLIIRLDSTLNSGGRDNKEERGRSLPHLRREAERDGEEGGAVESGGIGSGEVGGVEAGAAERAAEAVEGEEEHREEGRGDEERVVAAGALLHPQARRDGRRGSAERGGAQHPQERHHGVRGRRANRRSHRHQSAPAPAFLLLPRLRLDRKYKIGLGFRNGNGSSIDHALRLTERGTHDEHALAVLLPLIDSVISLPSPTR